MKIKNSQSGYTMLESIMYIGLLMMVVIAFVSVVHKMYGRYKISRMTSQVVEIAKAISDRCVASVSYEECIGGDVSAKMGRFLCDQNLQPKDMSCTNNGKLKYRNVTVEFNQWADVSLGRQVPKGQYYMMLFSNLTKQECAELATYDFGDNPYIDLDSMHIGPASADPDNAYRWPTDATNVGERSRLLPINKNEAARVCSSPFYSDPDPICEDTPKSSCMVHWVFD